MPQEFHVLQCFKCKTFQVQQVKKVLKWACKLCGEKQSVLRVYGRGSGAECRNHVQGLNRLRGEIETSQNERIVTATDIEQADVNLNNFQIDPCEVESNIQSKKSKWEKYVDPLTRDDDDDDNDDDDGKFTTDRKQYQTAIKKHQKQKRENSRKSKLYQAEDRSKWFSRKQEFKNQNTHENLGGMVQFGGESPRHINVKRPPESCMMSKTIKRSKWDDFEDKSNEIFVPEASYSEQVPKPYQNFNPESNSSTSMKIESSFDIIDDFFNEDVEDLTTKRKTVQKSPEKRKTMQNVPKKKSKWDAFVSESSDHEAELFIPEVTDSPDFELNSDPDNYLEMVNHESNPPGRNLSFRRSKSEMDSQKVRMHQTDQNSGSANVETNVNKCRVNQTDRNFGGPGKCLATDGQEVNMKQTSRPEQERFQGSQKKTKEHSMFQVNDFDDREFEFVI